MKLLPLTRIQYGQSMLIGVLLCGRGRAGVLAVDFVTVRDIFDLEITDNP